MQFRCFAFRFTFAALDPVAFAPGAAANAFRGAFGHIFRRIACSREAYASLFEPAGLDGPSGLADAPRPFVIRAAGLDGQSYATGDTFFIDVHVFQLRTPPLADFTQAFEKLADEGIGASRERVRLATVSSLNADREPERSNLDRPISLPLEAAAPRGPQSLTLRFLTPTELKSGGRTVRDAPFAAVFARARDRIATLSAMYGDGPLDLDFRGMGERAERVQTVAQELQWHSFSRTSSRTSQTHPLGGFTGDAHYCGELAEFLPFLRAAYWTGIGRQTVWGKGAIEIATSHAHVPTSSGR